MRAARRMGPFRRGAAHLPHDAVVAAAQFVQRLDGEWERLERDGHDVTITVGKFFTDPTQHAFSKVAGDVGLCIDVRSHAKPTLGVVKDLVHALPRTSSASAACASTLVR